MRDRILVRVVGKIHICVDRIFKEIWGSVHCLKYSIKKFKAQIIIIMFTNLYTQIWIITIASSYHLQQHGEKLRTKERRIDFGPLAVITLCNMEPLLSFTYCKEYAYIFSLKSTPTAVIKQSTADKKKHLWQTCASSPNQVEK